MRPLKKAEGEIIPASDGTAEAVPFSNRFTSQLPASLRFSSWVICAITTDHAADAAGAGPPTTPVRHNAQAPELT